MKDGQQIGIVERDDEVTESSEAEDPHERWSNNSAAELLMPPVVTETLWSTGMSVDDLSRGLSVSVPPLSR